MLLPKFFCVFSYVFLAVSALEATADAQPKPIGGAGGFSAHRLTETGGEVYYMLTHPTQQEGDFKKRGDVYLMITNRPYKKTKHEVHFGMGYPIKKETDVEITVEGGKGASQTFNLFSAGDGAWARDTKTDEALVSALAAHKTARVKGVSARGTPTIDTYDLKGFTATLKMIDEGENTATEKKSDAKPTPKKGSSAPKKASK